MSAVEKPQHENEEYYYRGKVKGKPLVLSASFLRFF